MPDAAAGAGWGSPGTRPRRVPGLPREALLVLLPLLALAVPATAQTEAGDSGGYAAATFVDPETAPRPVARATRTAKPIVVDGRVDEPAWQQADSLDRFVQSQPRRGYPATDRTVVRILYDDSNLYISALCFDDNPEELTVISLEEGFDSRESDVFGITLDTFLDRRNGFMLLVNPRGAIRYGQAFDDSRSVDLAWRGVVHARTQLHDWGWSLEMAIPWTTLRYDPSRAEHAFGLNFNRRVRRKNEDSYWAPLDRRDPVHRMSKAGTLEGLRGLPRNRNLSVKPYVAAGTASGELITGDARGGDLDGGFDVKYGVTPQLTLDLTYNTDFSQVEVDQEQVNLTRFSLFLPEKRDFFIENSGVFTFGDVSEREYRMGASLRDFTLFHSRRIGLEGGQLVPIAGGGRLTGRVGGFSVGLLNMQTGTMPDRPAENFAVARVRRTMRGALTVGGIVVNRQETGHEGSYNRSWGVDASARLFQNLMLSSYLAGTDGPGEEVGGNLAMRATAAWRDRLWDVSAMHKRVGEGFDPGVGYIRRRGMHHTYATVGAHPRLLIPGLQEMNPYLEADYITDPDGSLETRTLTVANGLDFLDGGVLTVSAADRFERLVEPFRVNASAEIPAGAFEFREGTVQYQSSLGRPLAAGASVSGGGYFHGDRLSLGLSSTWRPSYRIAVEVNADHNRIRLPGQEFTVDVYGARLKYSHSTRLFGSAYVQYNQALEQVISNVRVNLIHAPLSNLFLVYTERRGMGGGAGVMEQLLTAKITRMVSF